MNQIDRAKLPCKLIVEGKDDLFVIANIRNAKRLPDNFEIKSCDGYEKLSINLESYLKKKRPSIEVIGIVVDADFNLESRWTSIKDELAKYHYEIPKKPIEEGVIVKGEGRNPDIGIWLMPDNNIGMLENFVKKLIPVNDSLLPYAEEITAKIEAEGKAKYAQMHHIKGLIHTWLAWQEEPGTPLGQAITARYLTTDSELCNRFVAWLNTLFNPPQETSNQ